MDNIFFNAQHSPIGAYSSFTLGFFKGKKGGLGIELGGPSNQNIFIGIQTKHGFGYEAMPFYEQGEDERKRFDIERVYDDQSGLADKAHVSWLLHPELSYWS